MLVSILPCLRWLSCFKLLFCIIDYHVFKDCTLHIYDINWFPHWMSILERLPCLLWLSWFSGFLCYLLSCLHKLYHSYWRFHLISPLNVLFIKIAPFAFTVLVLLVVLCYPLSCLHKLYYSYWRFHLISPLNVLFIKIAPFAFTVLV